MLATGLMIFTQMPEEERETVTMRRSVATLPTQVAKPAQSPPRGTRRTAIRWHR